METANERPPDSSVENGAAETNMETVVASNRSNLFDIEKSNRDEEKRQLGPMRYRLHLIVDRWPRTFAFLHRQLVVCSLIGATLLGGYVISLAESPNEVSQNDLYLQHDWLLTAIPVQKATTALVHLPTACLTQYYRLMNDTHAASVGNATFIAHKYHHLILDLDNDMEWFKDFVTTSFPTINLPPFDPPVLPPLPGPTLEESAQIDDSNSSASTSVMYAYMAACEAVAGALLHFIVNITIDVARYDFQALESNGGGLTFNWNRCWDSKELGLGDPFRPNRRQIEASAYPNQSAYYRAEWNRNREALYRNYSVAYGCAEIGGGNDTDAETFDDDNYHYVTPSGDHFSLFHDNVSLFHAYNHNDTDTMDRFQCYWEATKESVKDATGGSGCQSNVGSSAWFWFTIMTTVGYGNFAPETQFGRSLVWCLGWVSIIAFGGIMILTGTTYMTIADDLFTRFRFNWFKNPLFGVIVWGIVSCLWIALIAWDARRFWNTHTPGYEYDTGDSYWFSYITVTTVGLGDFVLEPEGIFISDVFKWTALCLHGFVFITSFFGKVSDFLTGLFPQPKESFEYRLARTDLWGSGYNTPVSKSLELLKEIVQELEDRSDPITTTTTKIIFGNKSERKEHTYRSSFVGNDRALAPDGKTINYHRIRILIEKKNLLLKLLEDTQYELEDRVNNRFVEYLSSSAAATDPKSSQQFEQSLTSIEALRHEENVLKSMLMGTKEIRTNLQELTSMRTETEQKTENS